MKFLEKIRNLPEKTRKIILWLTIIVLAAGLIAWWIGGIPERFEGFNPGQFIENIKTNAQQEINNQ